MLKMVLFSAVFLVAIATSLLLGYCTPLNPAVSAVAPLDQLVIALSAVKEGDRVDLGDAVVSAFKAGSQQATPRAKGDFYEAVVDPLSKTLLYRNMAKDKVGSYSEVGSCGQLKEVIAKNDGVLVVLSVLSKSKGGRTVTVGDMVGWWRDFSAAYYGDVFELPISESPSGLSIMTLQLRSSNVGARFISPPPSK